MSTSPWHRDVPRPESITRVRTGLTQDLRGRERRYLTAMLIRTACVVLMALTWTRWPVVAVSALVGSVVIPYVAVVAAQAGWRQQRGHRPPLAPVPEDSPAPRTVLEPTLIIPPDQRPTT
ncbi:DUF3099 domain-containing protein [Streptomyces sp. JHA26]|uniref:DUF3099 domain-containing protein n=1 Tax=Streptomyces sp. JHA26 TaxID=1917143 RepID=UPI00098B13A0|nr:DUF3099 domain-containing protein [Streptomyces sp. JHA26]